MLLLKWGLSYTMYNKEIIIHCIYLSCVKSQNQLRIPDVRGITFKLHQTIQRNKHRFALQMTKGQTNLFAITLVPKHL